MKMTIDELNDILTVKINEVLVTAFGVMSTGKSSRFGSKASRVRKPINLL